MHWFILEVLTTKRGITICTASLLANQCGNGSNMIPHLVTKTQTGYMVHGDICNTLVQALAASNMNPMVTAEEIEAEWYGDVQKELTQTENL